MAETYKYRQTQPGRRRSYNVRDQWGRRWLAVVERETGDPVTMTPCFTDPLNTPLKFMRIPSEAPYTCEIDYDGWIAELDAGARVYEDRRQEVTRALHGDAADLDKKPTREIMRIIGRPPISVKRVKAAAAGNPRELGLRGTQRLIPRPPVALQPEPDFVDQDPDLTAGISRREPAAAGAGAPRWAQGRSSTPEGVTRHAPAQGEKLEPDESDAEEDTPD